MGTARVYDPPGVYGSLPLSGGLNPASGIVSYALTQVSSAAVLSCVLPTSEADLCSAIVATYLKPTLAQTTSRALRLGALSLGGVALATGTPFSPVALAENQVLPKLTRLLGPPKIFLSTICPGVTATTARWSDLSIYFVNGSFFLMSYSYRNQSVGALHVAPPPPETQLSPLIVTSDGTTVGDALPASRLSQLGSFGYYFDGLFIVGANTSFTPPRIADISANTGNC
jgi:hypothetical protein